jgi:hypothetical protein
VPVTRPRVTIEQLMCHLWGGDYHNFYLVLLQTTKHYGSIEGRLNQLKY